MQSKKIWNENLSNKLSFAANIGPVKDEIIKFKKLSNIIHTTNMAFISIAVVVILFHKSRLCKKSTV